MKRIKTQEFPTMIIDICSKHVQNTSIRAIYTASGFGISNFVLSFLILILKLQFF